MCMLCTSPAVTHICMQAPGVGKGNMGPAIEVIHEPPVMIFIVDTVARAPS